MSQTESQIRDLETTLLGDTRERVLDNVKRYIDWKAVPEVKQRALISAVEQICRENIRHIAVVAAGRGHPTYEIQVSGLSQKVKSDGASFIEAKITARDTDENAVGILRAGSCLLVKTDLRSFMGERAPSEVLKDQPDLMEEAEKTEAELEAEHVAQNTERLEEGIAQLETEGDTPHDLETGEVLTEASGAADGLNADAGAAAGTAGKADSEFGWSDADQQQKPKRSRKKASAPEVEPV